LEQRKKLIEAAGFKLFLVAPDDVTIDLLTDSGTEECPREQGAVVMRSDESNSVPFRSI